MKRIILALILLVGLAGTAHAATTAKQIDFLLAGYRHPTSDAVLSGGKVKTFLTGTSTLSSLWTDQAKGGTATNPVILDSSDKAEVYGDNLYKFEIYDSNDVLLETISGLEYKDTVSLLLDEDDMSSGSSTQAATQKSIVNYIRVFPTVSSIRSSSGPFKDNQIATIVEYDAGFQGAGGGQVFWDASSTATDNNITTYKVDSIVTGRFKRIFSGGVKAVWAGAILDGVADDTDAITDAVTTGNSDIILPSGTLTLNADVDCLGARIICHGTIIPNSPTLINHSGVVDGVLSGVNTSERTLHSLPAPAISFDNNVLLQALDVDTYMAYSPKKNPNEGLLEFRMEQNVTTTTNSIGGNANHRVIGVRNINALIAYKHTYDSASAVPAETVTRSYGSGTGGSLITYYTIAPTESITFSSSEAIDILSIGFLMTVGASSDVDITVDGTLLKNITLVKAAAEEELYTFRERIRATTGDIVITNNSATQDVSIAGINYFELTDDMRGDIDTFAFSRNTNDYTSGSGAVDYALRRPDIADPTGGSFHGGESITSSNFRLDYVTQVLSVGEIAYGKRLSHVSNVDVIWGDAVSVNVIRINTIGDGILRKELEIRALDVVFDAVWTTMWTTPVPVDSIRMATNKGVGVSSTMVTLERVNTVRQDDGTTFGIINSFTIYDNERNSNGGPYVNEVPVTYNKLYYGPILFNEGTIGEIHSVQTTEFVGID